jgi:hypothetical protein
MPEQENYISFHEIIFTLLGERGVNTLKNLPPSNVSLSPGDIGLFNDPTLSSRRKIHHNDLEDDENRRNTQLRVIKIIEDGISDGEIKSPDQMGPNGDIETLEFRIEYESFFAWFRNNPEKTNKIILLLTALDRIFPESWRRIISSGKFAIESQETEAEQVDKKDKCELTFYRVNKTWRVGFGEIKNINHGKGLTYYQYLFLHPNKHFSGLDIQILGNKQDINYLDKSGIMDDELKYTSNKPENDPTYSQPPQDAEESDTVKKELGERYSAYIRAEEDGSLDVDLLKTEYEEFLKIYNSLFDNKGKARDDATPQKRAIKAVAKNLKTAKENILEHLPELEELLKDIKTGNSFGYIPSNPDNPISMVTKQP